MNIIPQKSLLYKNIVLPLKDFPDGTHPKVNDKCLLIIDKQLCIPVYTETPESDSSILRASLTKDNVSAETGQTITKTGNVVFEN